MIPLGPRSSAALFPENGPTRDAADRKTGE